MNKLKIIAYILFILSVLTIIIAILTDNPNPNANFCIKNKMHPLYTLTYEGIKDAKYCYLDKSYYIENGKLIEVKK
jgi:hypothetical protein